MKASPADFSLITDIDRKHVAWDDFFQLVWRAKLAYEAEEIKRAWLFYRVGYAKGRLARFNGKKSA